MKISHVVYWNPQNEFQQLNNYTFTDNHVYKNLYFNLVSKKKSCPFSCNLFKHTYMLSDIHYGF